MGFLLASTSMVCASGDNNEEGEAATPGLVPQPAVPAAAPTTPAAATGAPQSPIRDVTREIRNRDNILNNRDPSLI